MHLFQKFKQILMILKILRHMPYANYDIASKYILNNMQVVPLLIEHNLSFQIIIIIHIFLQYCQRNFIKILVQL